ncbi:hypothetical protein M3P05_13410 [Sansalvadorimonas sp. 2012CJ34-2]|uniref:Uncharacterized protein n=1 Tax=Parendozoicomonas callyspongiae TaxID=2942213 RepID=A0ABT0PJK6_9GAMM|nr:hypothetical protein [Sansalvadorimonas sp. 2012CJ34-2]MCL6270922.1 hypothetical protein [Sansalvadorimonas sp. 2012CJ34-2]
MKTVKIKTIALTTLIATSGIFSVDTIADTVLYAHPGHASVKTQVFLDGKIAEGARVQLFTREGKLKSESVTSKYGYANFTQLKLSEPVKLIATTGDGETDSKWVMPIDKNSL